MLGRMAEEHRRPVPDTDEGELETTLAFLDFQREQMVRKLEGLSEEQVREVLVQSGTNLIGLVTHLTDGERYWFHQVFAGGPDREGDWGMDAPRGMTAAEAVASYREAWAESNRISRAAGDPGALSAEDIRDRPRGLRWVLAHMYGETARHAGHADIIREQIDGVTGR